MNENRRVTVGNFQCKGLEEQASRDRSASMKKVKYILQLSLFNARWDLKETRGQYWGRNELPEMSNDLKPDLTYYSFFKLLQSNNRNSIACRRLYLTN